MPDQSNSEWLTLSAAARMLGVHPSTVRLWADKGLLPVHRTKGGHRRFKRRDIDIWLQSSLQQNSLNPEEMISVIMRNIRFRIIEADLEKEAWYAKLDDDARHIYRLSGKKLIEGLMVYLASDDDNLKTEAHALGYEYASRAHRYNLSLQEAIQAFLFFRNTLFNSIYRLFSESKASFTAQHHLLLQRTTNFTDQIQANLIDTYLQM